MSNIKATPGPLLTGHEIDAVLHALTDQLEWELRGAGEALDDYRERLSLADRDVSHVWNAAHDLNAWMRSMTGTSQALVTLTKALVRADTG